MSLSLGGGSPERQKSDRERDDGDAEDERQDGDMFTDADGWVYGDNKWEGASGKGGMGKYTRFRRWTRIAVLSEIVEPVGPGEMGVRKDTPQDDANGLSVAASPVDAPALPEWQPVLGRPDSLDKKLPGEVDEDRLRRRSKGGN
ncbi:uncharacterized protein FIBRA_06536 [Fibroporia radiculosa]|uniref:Peroxin/Ferlin domain-containing protein n=1 Tax=Fibroporia radiculosa TaxID=599839 RepID=J4H447_9APHY|nr:uncharacterized protein FIBRA_06536 [Fibroporia radiculosa]CCM04364.1 predicted protein [Fibroporia radiculosa]